MFLKYADLIAPHDFTWRAGGTHGRVRTHTHLQFLIQCMVAQAVMSFLRPFKDLSKQHVYVEDFFQTCIVMFTSLVELRPTDTVCNMVSICMVHPW